MIKPHKDNIVIDENLLLNSPSRHSTVAKMKKQQILWNHLTTSRVRIEEQIQYEEKIIENARYCIISEQ